MKPGSVRILFQNFLAIPPAAFTKEVFGGDLPDFPKVASKKFVTDHVKKMHQKVCFATDLKLSTSDPPYARKFRTECAFQPWIVTSYSRVRTKDTNELVVICFVPVAKLLLMNRFVECALKHF